MSGQVITDSRYAGLAASAAAAMGAGSPGAVRGILSQWQCEGQSHWPPTRNNPGNIARGLATELGLAFTVSTPNPQPGNPIVTYPTPAIGAQAYAKAIATHSRYRAALNAARAGDGLGFVRAIGSSGWGTGTGCMLGVYRSSAVVGGGPNLPTGSSPAPDPGTGGGGAPDPTGGIYLVIQRILSTKLASSCTQYTVLAPGSAVADAMGAFPIPKENIGDPCSVCTNGWVPAVVTQQAYGPLGGWTDPATLPPDTANACVKAGMKEGQRIGPLGLPGAAADAAGSFLQSVPGLIVNAGLLGIAAYLILTGARDALSSSDLLEGA